MAAGDPLETIEQLERENAALNEQLKLLVRTEQRLYRSQNELDAQLQRIRDLAVFALEATGSEPTADILMRAIRTLSRSFALDWMGALRIDPRARQAWLECSLDGLPAAQAPLPLEPDVLDWLLELREARLVTSRNPITLRLALALLGGSVPITTPAEVEVACAPVHAVAADQPGALVVVSLRRRPAFVAAGPVTTENMPFLQLLAHHVDHAIASARLTESLRERSEQLSHSLESLERTQEQLLHAQKMEAIGLLAGGVAHDFNNLLTVILGYASALETSLPAGSAPHAQVQRVLEAARNAAAITAQLLALGRRQLQRPEDFDLGGLVGEVAGLLRGLVGERVRILLDLPIAHRLVHADRGQMSQVLVNLLVNARDAMPNGGRIRIALRAADLEDVEHAESAFAPGDYVALTVEDDGTGMDEATRSRIFEPFFTTKESGKGTGLGLAVVYGIVRQNEGHVRVESTLGQGSRFTVVLPRSGLHGGAAAPADPRRASRAGVTVLVVEDQQSIRDVMRSTLEQAGYAVRTAPDGERAIELVRAGGAPPGLVITDLLMPRLGGLALVEALREEIPTVRFGIMSGYSDELVDGPDPKPWVAYLPKPFTPTELVAFVDALMVSPRGNAPGG